MVDIGFVKHNLAYSKPGVVEENKKALIGFMSNLEGKVKGLKGYLILDGMKNTEQILILTFWETRQDMDSFYTSDNKALSDFVEKTKSWLQQPPERTDYAVVKFKM